MGVGVGSKTDNSSRAMQYRYADVEVFTDKNWSSPFSPTHPQMDGVFYWYKNGHDECMGETIKSEYGNLTAESLYRNIAPLGETGDTIMAVYSFATDEVYIAMAQNFQVAYNNPVFYLNMTEWWAVQTNDGELPHEENDAENGFLENNGEEI